MGYDVVVVVLTAEPFPLTEYISRLCSDVLVVVSRFRSDLAYCLDESKDLMKRVHEQSCVISYITAVRQCLKVQKNVTVVYCTLVTSVSQN